ncbi:MAG: putative membrane protein YfcA [Alphaproteobacteria bacterium]|jgi:uncharacterized membrane protein YfcA
MFENFAAMLNTDLLLAALIAALSGVIHGYTGFGAALVLVPLFTLLFGPVEAIAVSVVIGMIGSAQLYPGAVRNARWRELLPVCGAIIICTPVGVLALVNLDAEIIRRAMGAFVFLAASVLISGWVYRGPRGIFASAVAGGLAGSITGATGVGGPPLALYFLAAPQPVEVQRANIVIAIGAVIIMVLGSLFFAGGVGAGTLQHAIILAPAYVLGTWSGSRLFRIAPKEYFRRVALWLLLATGIGVLFF